MRILVSGGTSTLWRLTAQYGDHLGHLLTPASRNSVNSMWLPYACDNGCYSGLDSRAFGRMLVSVSYIQRKPLWVTAPDTVADADATAEQWPKYMMIIASYGLIPCYVLQDGQEHRKCLPDAQAFFIGGTTGWKMGAAAAAISAEVKRRGATLHMGRVNTIGRLRYAEGLGCDTVDGSAWSMWGDSLLGVALEAMYGDRKCLD